MREYPILFQPEMVQAIEPRRVKWQTRRTTKLDEVNENPDDWKYIGSIVNKEGNLVNQFLNLKTDFVSHLKCPYGAPGSILWVRETWCLYQTVNHRRVNTGASFSEISDGNYGYKADGFNSISEFKDHVRLMSDSSFEAVEVKDNKWKPSIHMPKDACRIYLQNTGVRIQRLQDISEEEAIAEGIEADMYNELWKNYLAKDTSDCHLEIYPSDSFKSLIQKINGPEIWDQNPWVRAISFRVLSTTGRPANLEELCAAS
ncbi:hypothetical protein AB6805_30455 [Chitinophaga sp. RCC_12]|uniref:hypothetical protein n=1 Tax=Chitinophaga sp. RCC_12 TaxID=3239226 RepID=UPI0035245724